MARKPTPKPPKATYQLTVRKTPRSAPDVYAPTHDYAETSHAAAYWEHQGAAAVYVDRVLGGVRTRQYTFDAPVKKLTRRRRETGPEQGRLFNPRLRPDLAAARRRRRNPTKYTREARPRVPTHAAILASNHPLVRKARKAGLLVAQQSGLRTKAIGCPACDGSGYRGRKPCSTCGNTGYLRTRGRKNPDEGPAHLYAEIDADANDFGPFYEDVIQPFLARWAKREVAARRRGTSIHQIDTGAWENVVKQFCRARNFPCPKGRDLEQLALRLTHRFTEWLDWADQDE